MGLPALQSFVNARPTGIIGSPWPTASPFPGDLRLFFAHRPPPLSKRVHPLMSFRSPAECCRSVPAPPLQLGEGAFPGVSSLFATSTGGVHLRGLSRSRSVPSTAFLTPSTVCSATGLAGLFHPAATSRVRSPGVFLPMKPYRLVDGPYPHVVGAVPLQGGCPPCATERRPAFRACSSPGSVATPPGFSRRRRPIPS